MTFGRAHTSRREWPRNLLAAAGRTDDAITAYRQALVDEAAFSEILFVNDVSLNARKALGASNVIEMFRREPAEEHAESNRSLLPSLTRSREAAWA